MTAQWGNIPFDRSAKPPVPMRLYEGKGKCKTPPLVLYLRGGAFLADNREQDERPVARALADVGAVVLEADYSSVSKNLFPHASHHAVLASAAARNAVGVRP